MNTLFGMKVLTSPYILPAPVLQVSPSFTACTDAFRAEMNQWLLDRFGTKDVAYVVDKNTLILNHDMLAKIKRSIPQYGLPFQL